MPSPVLEAASISKSFGVVRALSGVSVRFEPGEVHAVLGENGAGKSTLMGVIAGFVAPDAGQVLLHGQPLPLGQPAAVRSQGVQMVHQHFMLVQNFTVDENLALANLGTLGRVISVDELVREAHDRAKALGWDVDGSARTGDLPVGLQQRVEILKALAQRSEVLILDEPTASLSPDEVEDLFAVLRRLKSEGQAVILIAHKLSEVLAIADRVTVLCRGEVTGSGIRSEVDQDRLVEWMIGAEVPQGGTSLPVREQAVLSASNLTAQGDRGELALRGLDLETRAGEILGIGGVDGNGQVELAEVLAGIRPLLSGDMVRPPVIGYVPQDRQRDGLALDLSLEDNLLIGSLENRNLAPGGWLAWSRIRPWANDLAESFRVKMGSISDPARSLSGGNQQKIVVARAMSRQPDLLVAVNPTRGLDVQAAQFVHDQLRQAAGRGAAVVLISTDRDELAALSHRILYLNRGELVDTMAEGVA